MSHGRWRPPAAVTAAVAATTSFAALVLGLLGCGGGANHGASGPALGVVVDLPPGWGDAPLDAPDLSQTPQLTLTSWKAWGPLDESTHRARLVEACAFAATDSWTSEAEPIALDRIAQLAASTALRIAEIGALKVVGTERANGVITELREGDSSGAKVIEKSFLGFPKGGIGACFALCVPRAQPDGRDLGCEESVRASRAQGGTGPPPPPGWTLHALLLGIHNPRAAVAGAVALSLFAGVVALITRKRPRGASSSPRRR